MKNTDETNPCPTCGQPIPEDSPQGLCPACVMSEAATQSEPDPAAIVAADFPNKETVAAAFPNLEILEHIGHGGMGIVYRARQPHLDRMVALKILPQKLGTDPHFAERFSREARTLARLSHPNIVAVYDFGHTGELYYLMMEYVDGVNLREAMRAGRFSPGEALQIVPKICGALHYAHEQNILHRDIKPENILLDSKGTVKIADFGIAKLMGESGKNDLTLTSKGQTLGTPHYMAPEQIENPTSVDHRADIYSLGVVLYELLTGELPIGRFEVPSNKSDVGAGVDEVVLRALEKDRERRQPSAERLKTEVQTAHQQPRTSNTSTQADTFPAQAPRWSVKALIAATLTTLGLLTLLIPLLISFIRPDHSAPIPFMMFLFPGMGIGAIGSLLGWVALSDIRHARGSLFGLPLGGFAALALPVLILNGLILGVPWLIAARTIPFSPLSPFSWFLLGTFDIVLSLSIIVATFRWATQRRVWTPLSRGQKIMLAAATILAILFVVPVHRSSLSFQPVPPQPIESRVDSKEVDLASLVEVKFERIALIESAATPEITLSFLKTEHGDAEIGWTTRGGNRDTPNRLDSSAQVQARPDGTYAPIIHTVTIPLPPALSQASQRELLVETRNTWQNRTLVVFPGEYHTILNIHQESGTDLELGIIGLPDDATE